MAHKVQAKLYRYQSYLNCSIHDHRSEIRKFIRDAPEFRPDFLFGSGLVPVPAGIEKLVPVHP